jgi:hypothetical protein
MSLPAIPGIIWSDQVVPFHTSEYGRPSSVAELYRPMATHDDKVAHDTPTSEE